MRMLGATGGQILPDASVYESTCPSSRLVDLNRARSWAGFENSPFDEHPTVIMAGLQLN